MTPQQKRWLIRTVAVLVAGVVIFFAWQHYGLKETETGLVSGNGRIEAVEIDVAAKTAGRLKISACAKANSSPPDRWWR